MEGKAVLFKRFADIDGIDLEVDTRDVAEPAGRQDPGAGVPRRRWRGRDRADRAKPQDGSGAERRGSAGRVAVLLDGGTRLLCPGPQDRVLPAIAGLPRPEPTALPRASAGQTGRPSREERGGPDGE